CILPRKRDTFSPYTAPENITKAAEYLAVGKPVIAPKFGGFANADFPVIAVEPEDMGAAVVAFLKNPIPIGEFEKPSWDESHRKLRLVYKYLEAI
ncbi:MAG: glycosyltransferase, partial [Promethearchaeota archaeon]